MTTKRRARGDGSYRLRGRNSWELKFDAGTDLKTGRRVTRYVNFKGTEREARSKLRELIGQAEKGTLVEPHKLKVGQFLEKWLTNYAASTASAKTYERWAELITLHVIPHIGNVPLTRLQPLDLQGLYTTLLTEGRRDGKGGLSPRTVHHVHTLLAQALKKAVAWKMLASSPADNATPPKVEDKEVETLTQDELATLLACAQGTKLYMPTLLAATTGMRRGEVLGLRWSDVDLMKGEVQVQQSLEQTKSGLRFKAPKSKRSRRTITLPSLTVAALRRHRAQQAEERLALGLGGNDWLVFTRYDGETVNPRNFTKEFSRMVRNAIGRPFGFHGLRHTHITNLLAAGEHIKVVSERAGHASVAITLEIYAHAIPGMQEDVAKRLDASLRAVLENEP